MHGMHRPCGQQGCASTSSTPDTDPGPFLVTSHLTSLQLLLGTDSQQSTKITTMNGQEGVF